jgi:hypothetical protein
MPVNHARTARRMGMKGLRGYAIQKTTFVSPHIVLIALTRHSWLDSILQGKIR